MHVYNVIDCIMAIKGQWSTKVLGRSAKVIDFVTKRKQIGLCNIL